MARNKIRSYIDLVEVHPGLTDEEMDKLIEEEKKKSAQLTDWEPM